jgi:ribosomal-protein-alanine N-acetyltransferase
MNLPQIETARLRLRPFTLDDLDALHRFWTDPDVRRYLWDDRTISREQAEAMLQSSLVSFQTHGFGQWAVIHVEHDSLIGFCGLRSTDDPLEAELLYGIAPPYWGQGLATEAARAVLRYGFEEKKLARIVASADRPNVASVRVMERAGMRCERYGRFASGGEAVYFALSREEFQPGTAFYLLRRA